MASAGDGGEPLKIPLDGLDVAVHLLDNTIINVKVKVDSTVHMLNVVIRDHLGIKKDRDFGLYAYKSGEFKHLPETERFSRVFERWTKADLANDTRRLYYRPSLYLPGSDLEVECDLAEKASSPAYHRLAFADCVHWFLVGHHRFPAEEVTELAALLWYIFRGPPGTPGAEQDAFQAAYKYMVPAYAVKRALGGGGSSASSGKSAVSGSDSPWSASNATKDAPHPVSGKIPYMRLHLSSEAASLEELSRQSWQRYTAMSFKDRFAAEHEFIEQNKEYIPFGADFFIARHTYKDKDANDSDAAVRQRTTDVLVSIGHEGIHLVSMKDPLSLQTHEYGQITKWTVSRDGKVFAYSLEDAAIVYLVSALAPAIEASVERYVVALLAKQKGKAESHRKALSAAEKAKAPTLLGEAEGRPHHFAIGGSAATAHAPPTTIEEGDEGVGEEAGSDEEPPAATLPPGWKQIGPDEEGDIYYVNDITGESRWDPPEAEEATQLLPGWERVEDDDGDVFYVNAETGESQWDPPLAGAEEAGEVGGGVDFGGEPEETTEDELGPLPDGWAKVGPDEEGDVYYINEGTGESQWERPTE